MSFPRATQPLSDVFLLVNVLRKSNGLAPDALFGFDNRDRSLSNTVCQRRTLDELEHERLLPFRFFQPIDVADVGMIQ